MGTAKRAALEPTAATANDDALLAVLAAGLRLQSNDTLWKVSGNTLAHRNLLRDAGGTWNRLDQCWEFTGDDPTAKLVAALEAVPATVGHNSGEPAAPKPHYHGHRGRVRERVLKAGIESLPDYELLELLLFYAIERIDTKPLAKRLIERFGTLGDIFAVGPALDPAEGPQEAGSEQLAAADRLLPCLGGARKDRAILHPVPEPQERAD